VVLDTDRGPYSPTTFYRPRQSLVISRWLPTTVISTSGICDDKVALGQVSSEYFGFPCQILIPILPKLHMPWYWKEIKNQHCSLLELFIIVLMVILLLSRIIIVVELFIIVLMVILLLSRIIIVVYQNCISLY
jgi:hypothetical protein